MSFYSLWLTHKRDTAMRLTRTGSHSLLSVNTDTGTLEREYDNRMNDNMTIRGNAKEMRGRIARQNVKGAPV